MIPNKQVTLSDLFSQYIVLRQSGTATDQTVQQLTPLANQLSRSDRQQLGNMVQSWEAKNGAYHKPSSTKPTQPTPEVSAKPKSLIRPLQRPSEATTNEPMQICPHCQKKNPAKEYYCYACGHMLKSNPAATKQIDDVDSKTRWGTAHLGNDVVLCLQVRGTTTLVRIPTQDEIVLGRVSPESPLGPDVDLSPYDAKELGVSRLHAAIRRSEHTVSLVDMQSSNRTYINGQRLYAHEVRVLRDGDEIRLGKLSLVVVFKR